MQEGISSRALMRQDMPHRTLKLFLVENLVLGDKAGTDSKVLLGSQVIVLKVVAVVETCPAEVSVPGHKVDAEFGLVSSQHSPVEVGQHSKVSSQSLCPQGGACSSRVVYSRTIQARSAAL